ncbi:hypothetical protein [Streptomyces sp. NEAU-S7GS2]|uniref:hypothetical protein n=1 Tax=Streptomyces sp. NEAU-S7GS2 TaxID=2202000 RepID=UPI000D6F874E|nr:hypothetical protein [Streptomyces sp. NEAU-S7GS2]AWN24799.1 hypothetical protein DKG71_00150 [Streptomyces sp. NEAU-S7GS2]
MSVVALAGVMGAPGVTTTALALLRTWPVEAGRRMVLAECDPDGGAILAGALQGRFPADRGLRNLALASRAQDFSAALWTQLIGLRDEHDVAQEAGRRLLLPGLTDPAQAVSMAAVWGQLSGEFAGMHDRGVDVLVDLGRGGAFGPSAVLALQADVVVMVVRGTMRSLDAAKVRVAGLRRAMEGPQGRGVRRLAVVLVAQGPYGAREVSLALEVPVVATLPFQPGEAEVLSDGAPEGRQFRRSELMRAAASACLPIRQQMVFRPDRVPSGVDRLRMKGAVGRAR